MSGSIHGGAFWSEVGNDMDRLASVVRADVLDAWFPPAPAVIAALREHSIEFCRTSPEADAGPLRAAISQARGIPIQCVLTHGGSSALIFLALPILAREAKTALILDPMYGEYRHVFEQLDEPPRVVALPLSRRESFRLDPARLFDFPAEVVVIVNPNSPTGQHVASENLRPVVEELAKTRIVWIDETYIEYAGPGESLERVAAENRNVIVCKSMSKVYALSGLRAAYLVAHPDRVAQLAPLRPPWAVSLPAQVCGAFALGEPEYYAGRYEETAALRNCLRKSLEHRCFEITDGVINSLLVHLPADGPSASEVCMRAASRGIYLRDAGSMGITMGTHTLRVAVRTSTENARIADAIHQTLAITPVSAHER